VAVNVLMPGVPVGTGVMAPSVPWSPGIASVIVSPWVIGAFAANTNLRAAATPWHVGSSVSEVNAIEIGTISVEATTGVASMSVAFDKLSATVRVCTFGIDTHFGTLSPDEMSNTMVAATFAAKSVVPTVTTIVAAALP
jgi:hypothetical protein